MPRINTYSDNASIENDDKMLTYDTQAAATKLTAFSIVWNWIVSKLHALTSSGAALTPSTDRVLMDKNGTMTRVEPAAVARYGIETYNGSTIAGSAQTVKSALDTLNSKLPGAGVGWHNSVYRGKNITSYLTDGSLWNRIKGAGGYDLFADLFLGDYITVGSNSYAIVDFDYYIRCGSVDVTEHHVVMMPTGNMNIPAGTALYGVTGESLTFINTTNAGVTVSSQESATGFKWNATMEAPNTHSTAGGYKYSRMRRVIMKAAETVVINAFGSSHVKPITVLYYNPSAATDSGLASGWAWFSDDDRTSLTCKSICDLPNELQIYGSQVWGQGSAYNNVGYEIGIDKFQFAICALQRNFVNTRADWWLRSVYSAAGAASVDTDGDAGYGGSAYALGVRPRFLLVG